MKESSRFAIVLVGSLGGVCGRPLGPGRRWGLVSVAASSRGSVVGSVLSTVRYCPRGRTFVVSSGRCACTRLNRVATSVARSLSRVGSRGVKVMTRGQVRACTTVLTMLTNKGACIVLRPTCPRRHGLGVTTLTKLHALLYADSASQSTFNAKRFEVVSASQLPKGTRSRRRSRSSSRREGTCVVFASKDANRPGKIPVAQTGLGTFCQTCDSLS